jgi:hypothetical protein
VSCPACARVIPRDVSRRVDAHGLCSLARSSARSRSLEGSESAIGGAHETVKNRGASHALKALVISRDRPHRVDARDEGVGRARTIEGGHRAIGGTHEAVNHTARVSVIPRDGPRCVDATRARTLICACARARSIERGEGGRLLRGRLHGEEKAETKTAIPRNALDSGNVFFILFQPLTAKARNARNGFW